MKNLIKEVNTLITKTNELQKDITKRMDDVMSKLKQKERELDRKEYDLSKMENVKTFLSKDITPEQKEQIVKVIKEDGNWECDHEDGIKIEVDKDMKCNNDQIVIYGCFYECNIHTYNEDEDECDVIFNLKDDTNKKIMEILGVK